MLRDLQPTQMLANWVTILGRGVKVTNHFPERALWLVKAEDGTEYFLKRLGPWRNLPLADEARILRFLSQQGVRVAEFLPTEQATLYAGEVEDSIVLIPRLPSHTFNASEIVGLEEQIGNAVAELHLALAKYPWSANSYTENLSGSLKQALMLPPTIADRFAVRRAEMVVTIEKLPIQLVHGDMTPENILLRQPSAVSGFIDFDHVPLAPRTWDIAKYLSRRLRNRWRHDRMTHPRPMVAWITSLVSCVGIRRLVR